MRRRARLAIAAAAFVVAGVVAVGVAGFPREPVPRASSRPMALPGELEPVVFNACIPTTDLATLKVSGGLYFSLGDEGAFRVRIADPGSWSVQVGRRGARVTTEDGGGDPASDGSSPARAVAVAQQLYDCMKGYRFVAPSSRPQSSSQLLQLYKYDTAVLWPCLRNLGLDPGPPPTRADFVTKYTAQNVSPYRVMNLDPGDLRLLVASARLCPSRPGYLGVSGG